jgi:hypothetical protein
MNILVSGIAECLRAVTGGVFLRASARRMDAAAGTQAADSARARPILSDAVFFESDDPSWVRIVLGGEN